MRNGHYYVFDVFDDNGKIYTFVLYLYSVALYFVDFNTIVNLSREKKNSGFNLCSSLKKDPTIIVTGRTA